MKSGAPGDRTLALSNEFGRPWADPAFKVPDRRLNPRPFSIEAVSGALGAGSCGATQDTPVGPNVKATKPGRCTQIAESAVGPRRLLALAPGRHPFPQLDPGPLLARPFMVRGVARGHSAAPTAAVGHRCEPPHVCRRNRQRLDTPGCAASARPSSAPTGRLACAWPHSA
jgi:hypothetical protein